MKGNPIEALEWLLNSIFVICQKVPFRKFCHICAQYSWRSFIQVPKSSQKQLTNKLIKTSAEKHKSSLDINNRTASNQHVRAAKSATFGMVQLYASIICSVMYIRCMAPLTFDMRILFSPRILYTYMHACSVAYHAVHLSFEYCLAYLMSPM